MKRRRRYLLTLLLCLLMVSGCNDGSWSSGDRVLVAKFLYDMDLTQPKRYDVVVFRYPERPIENGTPKNYIKRLLGLPGELLAIFFGRIYRASTPVEHPEDRNEDPNDLWQKRFLHSETLGQQGDGKTFWQEHKFEILRKPLDTLLAMRRSVYDNDFPAKDLQGVLPPRWAGGRDKGQPASNWIADDPHGFRTDGQGAGVDWLRYQHILRPNSGVLKGGPVDTRPQLITDFLAYNSFVTNGRPPDPYVAHNWVGDLMLECKVKVEKASGEFTMELSKGKERFQAIFDLQSGDCTLVRLTDKQGGKQERVVLGSKTTRLKAPGEYDLRFANVDERLTVWVDRDLPFDDGVAYPPPTERGPWANDLQPASLGSKGAAVAVHHLKLWRDTYYTLDTHRQSDVNAHVEDWADPAKWQPLRDLDYRTLYVQPGHYLCLGDNSPQSSDSREWGTVPERLLLGRALMVYFPFDRAGRIK